jgi:SAM-dependent methyltransferase
MSLDYSLHYEYWHPDTAEHIAAMRRYFATEIAPSLPVERTGRALDIGCGFGYAMLALGDLGFAPVEGVEASEQQAARARKYGLSVAITADTISWLSGWPDTFAVVLLLDVLEHFPNEQQIPLLAAIHRSLIPGGRLIVRTPNANSIVASRWRYIDFTHHTSFTEHSLSFALRNAGYDRIDIGSEKGVRRPNLAFLETQILRRGLATVPGPMVLAAGLQGGISAGESFPDQLRSEPSGCRPQGKAKRRRPSLEERAGS